MNSKILMEARQYEEQEGNRILPENRPLFHLTPRIGWMNDPNGFSQYNGCYHLFYQYYPYSKKWGPMHWGHATSKDLLKWDYLPAALAPDTDMDSGGCFSGSAVTLDNGQQLLMYTGVVKISDIDETMFTQTQCVATGDGTDYVKYDKNPVIGIENIPYGLSEYDFRDPKVWREKDGTFRCVVGACTKEKLGRILYFKSEDGFHWDFISVLAENDGSLGNMWECPDFFELDGKYVLLTSPQDCIQTKKYNCGNITVAMIGTFDEKTGKFIKESEHLVDAGIDFYATQTLLSDDGRRLMTAWMQNWDSITYTTQELHWFGQMIVPRELSVRDGHLMQKPVREIEKMYSDNVVYKDVSVGEESVRLDGIEGRIIDMTVEIRPKPNETYRKFELRFAEDDDQYTSLVYRPKENKIWFDRTHAGSRRAVIHTRRCKVADRGGNLKLRILADRFSVEVFVNDGEQTITNCILTDQKVTGISFTSDGGVMMDVEKHSLNF